eukprot:g16455.t1
MIVNNDAELALTTSIEAMELVNIRFEVHDGSTLHVQLPNLQWHSVEEEQEDEVIFGGALYIADGAAEAYFEEDVTFTGCFLPFSCNGLAIGAVANMGGKLVFEKSASIIGTTNGGGLYSKGTVEFHGEALFQDNKKSSDYYIGGAGIRMRGGQMTFKAAASFVGNEVEEYVDIGASQGNIYYGGDGGAIHVVSENSGSMTLIFEGPVLFRDNKAYEGAALYMDAARYEGTSGNAVVFEDVVTLEGNEAPRGCGGAVILVSGDVYFQAGVSATGNIAKDGGVFCVGDDESTLDIAGPVSMTGNTALYQGGAIFNKGNVTLPQDTELSGNTAVTCPSIKNWEEWEHNYLLETHRSRPDGSVEFTGGSSYAGSSREICYLGEPEGNPGSPLVLTPETADCESLFSAGTNLGGYAYTVLDTRVVPAMQIEVGTGDFELSCAKQSGAESSRSPLRPAS